MKHYGLLALYGDSFPEVTLDKIEGIDGPARLIRRPNALARVHIKGRGIFYVVADPGEVKRWRLYPVLRREQPAPGL